MNEISGLEITPFRDMEQAVGSIIDPNGTVNPGFAIAVNAEKIIAMRKNSDLRKILKSATLRYADGIGVVWALNRKGANCTRIPGCELWEKLMEQAAGQNVPVFLVGAKPETLLATQQKLQDTFGANLVGCQHGYFENEEDIVQKIKQSGAKIVTVALGSPKQENFVAKCRESYPDALYMGVGGTYDVFVGNVQRAPRWARKWHLEWFYRLMKQPTRIFRQTVLLQYAFLAVTNRL